MDRWRAGTRSPARSRRSPRRAWPCWTSAATARECSRPWPQWQYPGPTEGSVLDTGTIAGAVQRLTVVDLDGTLLIAEVGTFEWTTESEALEANELVDTASFE